MDAIVQPTGEQCTKREIVDVVWRGSECKAMATWYPQMGGSVGKCLVILPEYVRDEDGDACFYALVWHDGDFPFGDDHEPVEIHHCNAHQFIRFGEDVRDAIKANAKEVIS